MILSNGVSEYFWVPESIFYNDMAEKLTLQVHMTFQNQWKMNVYIIYHARISVWLQVTQATFKENLTCNIAKKK